MAKLEKIKLDLETYKILLKFHDNKESISIHFDTPSRRFYFALIALIVIEMKDLNKAGYIHIRKHENTLKLLDKSLAGKHVSKSAEDMWIKIRKAWRDRLPDLETAPLFKIIDRDLIAPYEKGGKYRYDCSDDECDIWANFFDYDKSNPWRFKFAIDSASLSLNDISVTIADLRGNAAWLEFLRRLSIQPKAVSREKKASPRWWKKLAFSLVAVSIVGAATFTLWKFYVWHIPATKTLELPDKPSIAVLAFKNLTGDPEQEYFSDGISEEIITALSKIDRLFVIARNSSFIYKGKPVGVQQIGKELGVRYVLEGSVKKSGDQVRITAQLIDAIYGQHLWAERYDRDLKDIFAIQDEITLKILTGLQVKLTEGEQARMWGKKYKNLEVYLKLMEGLSLWRKGTKESFIRYRQVAHEMIEMAPEYAIGYRFMAWSYWGRAISGVSPRESIAKAFELAQKALSIDETDAYSHSLVGNVYLMKRQYEKAIAAGEKSVELDPNSAYCHGLLGSILCYADRLDEGIDQLKHGIRLNPFPSYWYYLHLGRCYRQKGQYEEAATTLKKAVDRYPDAWINHMALSAVYILLDREEEGHAEAVKALELNPNFSLERASKSWPYKNQAQLKLFVDALNKAGFK